MDDKKIYLRFLTTYKCNYSCKYCFREGVFSEQYEKEMPVDIFSTVLQGIVKAGLKKIKLVGGEPLLSNNLFAYLQECFLTDCEEIGISTNGHNFELIKKLALSFPKLKFNFSIPSIDATDYQRITGIDGLSDALKSLDVLNEMKINPTINYVIYSTKQINESLPEILENLFHRCNRVKLLIFCKTEYNSIEEPVEAIEENLFLTLSKYGYKIIDNNYNSTKHFYKENKELCVLRPYCPSLCKELHSEIQTIRITPDGIIKPCLLYNSHNIKLNDNITAEEVYRIVKNLASAPLPCDIQ